MTNSQSVEEDGIVAGNMVTTGWTKSGCSFNTVVKPGCTTSLTTVLNEQSVRSTERLSAVSCIRTFNWLSNQFDNRIDNQLDVCLHNTASCQTGCIIGLTTGCIVSCKRGINTSVLIQTRRLTANITYQEGNPLKQLGSHQSASQWHRCVTSCSVRSSGWQRRA